MEQIDTGVSSAALAQRLLQLHAMLPELTSRILETQQTCDEAVRALSQGGLEQMMVAETSLGHRASVSTIIRGRQLRAKFIPENWFSDPAWDILLHLYEAHLDGVEHTVGDLGSFARTTPATTNRWLDVLFARQWIQRRRCERDQRRIFVSLTPAGAETMNAYFNQLRQPTAQ
ncbi:MarR family transcriptional regulator [Sphingomonas sp. S2-65]|uniref:MarR family transcriptional regulator n=1 Tax=Sphingomonas sp. S2-65 TaxID=2903960 RepID=UPI001F2DC475|nr:MarR family transcriptional regulator [Sphingomonas sp. S2-65]UYY59232.1 MarR family transcriptional regulator [Sphingomonas sp. S2-65]